MICVHPPGVFLTFILAVALTLATNLATATALDAALIATATALHHQDLGGRGPLQSLLQGQLPVTAASGELTPALLKVADALVQR